VTRPPKIQGKKYFNVVFKKGIRVRIHHMTLYFHAVAEGPVRAGVVVSASIGAVARNRMKRRMWSLLRAHTDLFPEIPGLLILQYNRNHEAPFGALHNDFVSGLGRIRACSAP